MEEKLRKFEEYRAGVCKKANAFLFIGIALMVLGIILIMAIEEPLYIILLVVGLIFTIVNSSMKSKLSSKFKQEIIIDLVRETYPGCTYMPRNGLTFTEMMTPGLFKRPDKWYTEDYLKTTFDDVEFEMCDFTFQERHVTTDSKGHTRTTYVTYAKGRFMVFDYKREFNQVVKIVENAYLGVDTYKLSKIETESLEFNKKFKVFTSDSLTAFYVLTPQIQLKLLELESKFKGSIYFAYMKGKLYVAICDNVSILDINASKKVSLETIETLKSQLLLPASIINELGLSSSKYQEGDAI